MMARLRQALAPARRVLVLAHRDPDGDAIGSVLGLMHLLKSAGKLVFAHRAGQVAEEYAFLPGLDMVREDLPQAEDVDLAVLLDCHEPERAGRLAEPLLKALPRVAVMDHHMGAADFGQPRWVDPAKAATAQMVTLLAQEMGLPISKDAATCLFVGLQTDTGRFCYSNTTPQALKAAADLVAAGADPWAVTQEAYSTSLARLRLFARVTDRLELLAGGRLALATAKASDLVDLGCPPSDLDRIVEEFRAIRGVEVAALVKEIDQNSVKASLRSRGRVDVGALALALGGGGHHNAAGARLEGTLQEAAGRLGELLRARLAEDRA
ncbi:MAG: bifunctional oligoribonuclease/PAP phosphatase NrnA [Desulfarculus sp.]|nr:bifunctional oligoribonuclease/PAP phosphatase NrnA [Desulfarculus sp.]